MNGLPHDHDEAARAYLRSLPPWSAVLRRLARRFIG